MSLLRIDEQLAINEQPLNRSMYVERFARLLKKNGIGHIKFLRNISDEELHELIVSLSGFKKVTNSSENLRLGQIEVRHRSNLGQYSTVQLATHLASDEISANGALGDGETNGNFSSEHISDGSEKSPRSVSTNILDDISCEELARVMDIYDAVKSNRQLQVVGLSDIALDSDRLSPKLLNALNGLRHLLLGRHCVGYGLHIFANVSDHDVSAFFGHELRRREAITTGSSRDNGHLAFKFHSDSPFGCASRNSRDCLLNFREISARVPAGYACPPKLRLPLIQRPENPARAEARTGASKHPGSRQGQRWT
jgi:hypothetical protein